MSQSPQDVARRWFEEVWNKGRLDAVDELATEDAKGYGFPQPDSALNREQFKQYVMEFRESFSHVHVNMDETVSEGYRIAVRWTGHMKHTGSGLGFPATGQTVQVHGMTILHLREGRICEGWNALDLGSVIQFLSAVSAR